MKTMTVDVRTPLNDPAYIRLVAELRVAADAQKKRAADADKGAKQMHAEIGKAIDDLRRRRDDAEAIALAHYELWLRTARALLELEQAHGLPPKTAKKRLFGVFAPTRQRPLPDLIANAKAHLPQGFVFEWEPLRHLISAF